MRKNLILVALCLLFRALDVAEPNTQSSTTQRVQTVTSIQAPTEQPKQDVLSILLAAEREKVGRSAVPVLLPSNLRDFKERNLIVEDMYYSAFFKDETQSISVQGSRVKTEYPGLNVESNESKKSLRSTQGLVTESENIWSASWNEYGAAYVVSVECTKAKDSKCESEAYVIKLANSLTYVGGGKTGADIRRLPAGNGGTPAANGPRILSEAAAAPPVFAYNPPGKLLPGSGTGRADNTVYSPEMRFPIENKPAYANSQVYNPGGNMGPGGGQCAASNYSFPWWDNFCEKRDRGTPMCPTGKGHQGQDIRPPSCQKDKYFGVSATDGTVTHIGGYSVFITAADGTQYRYLHMSNVEVKVADKVRKGQHIGRVSNVFTAPTTIHLHFEIVQNISGPGFVHVPPYLSLVKAYERLP